MTWYQSLAGANIPLSEKTRSQIGVAGFGVDDLGVIGGAEAVGAVLNMGLHLKAVDDATVSRFVELEHGSKDQVREAERLTEVSLQALNDKLRSCVDEKLANLPGVETADFVEFGEWAEKSGWELPVGCLDTDFGRTFCIADEPGLCVFDCQVAQVPGLLGDVLMALVAFLSAQSLKTPAHVAADYAMMMGLEASELRKQDGFAELRKADGAAVLKWLKIADEEMYRELLYWDDSQESMEWAAMQARDIGFAHLDEERRVGRVMGSPHPKDADEALQAIRQSAMRCPDSDMRRFVIEATTIMMGDSTATLIDRIPRDARCERIPGGNGILETGLAIEGLEDRYHYLNEISMNGDEGAILPLETDPQAVFDLLLRLTLAERLILALAALLSVPGQLSELQAA